MGRPQADGVSVPMKADHLHDAKPHGVSAPVEAQNLHAKPNGVSATMEAQNLHGKPPAEGEWSTDFCACFSDCSNCCITYWCPCITYGRVAEIVDRGSTSARDGSMSYMKLAWLTGFACMYSCCLRTKMRKEYNIKGSECGDCLKHLCCELCALTQLYRELKTRGFDVELGWRGNVERKKGGVAMAVPVVQSGMKR